MRLRPSVMRHGTGQQHLSLMDTRFRVGGDRQGSRPEFCSPSTPPRPALSPLPVDFRRRKAETGSGSSLASTPCRAKGVTRLAVPVGARCGKQEGLTQSTQKARLSRGTTSLDSWWGFGAWVGHKCSFPHLPAGPCHQLGLEGVWVR